MNLYTIKNWDANFENRDTRRSIVHTWWKCPNRFDGNGYRRMLAEHDGEALYGAWCALCGLASKMPKRGVLADDVGPLNAHDVSICTGYSKAIIQRLLAVTSDPVYRIAWVDVAEVAEPATQPPAPLDVDNTRTPDCPPDGQCVDTGVSTEERREEGELEESREEESNAPDAGGAASALMYKPRHLRIVFDYDAGALDGVLDDDTAEWADAYPAVDVPAEIKRAEQWLKDNPAKRKKNVSRFLTNWMARCQERGGGKSGAPGQAGGKRWM